jgi:lipoprotein-releasing system permease protein
LNFSFYIAKRYIFSKSNNNAINIISKIAFVGIVVGALVLFVFMSIFSGLKTFSLSFSNNFDPDLKIFPKYGKSFVLSKQEKKGLKNNQNIAFYSKIIEERVLFVYKNKEQVSYLKAVDNQYGLVNKVGKVMYQGQWLSPETPQVVIGNVISQKLSLGLFDMENPLEVFVPKPGKGSITNPENAFNKTTLIPVGIYSINDELDAKYVFADLTIAQQLLEYAPDQITAIEIKLKNIENSNEVAKQLNSIFNNQVIIKNRKQLNDSLYKMLNTENTILYLICTLVIILILFTLAGAIIMMIIDKQPNLRTLYCLGTPVSDLKNIFLFHGAILTFIGGLIGLLIGIVLVVIQQYHKIIMITETLAYPVVFNFENVLIVMLTINILGLIATLIASNRVNNKLLRE